MSGPAPVYALLGRPVGRSRSPAMHQRWLRQAGLPGVYVALEVPAGLEGGVVAAVRCLGLAGANVTVPLKEAVMAGLDGLSAEAEALGAVNTLVWEGERLMGHNTDAPGLLAAFSEAGVSLSGARVLVLGAGGAGRAAAYAAREAGAAQVVIANRELDRAERLAERFGGRAVSLHAANGALAAADVVVNAVSEGGRAAVARLDASAIFRGKVWMDLNYWDEAPPCRAQVLAAGGEFLTGHAMLVHQAALSFRRWTGVMPVDLSFPV